MSGQSAEKPEWEQDLERELVRRDAVRCGGCGKSSNQIASEAVRYRARDIASE